MATTPAPGPASSPPACKSLQSTHRRERFRLRGNTAPGRPVTVSGSRGGKVIAALLGQQVRPLPTLLSLLDGLLTYDPSRRLDASTALAHSWFSERPFAVTPERLASARLPQAVDHGLHTPELGVGRQVAHGPGSHHRPAKRGHAAGACMAAGANSRHEERLTACAQDLREEELEAWPQRKEARREEDDRGAGSLHGPGESGVRPARAIRIPSPTSISASASRQL